MRPRPRYRQLVVPLLAAALVTGLCGGAPAAASPEELYRAFPTGPALRTPAEPTAAPQDPPTPSPDVTVPEGVASAAKPSPTGLEESDRPFGLLGWIALAGLATALLVILLRLRPSLRAIRLPRSVSEPLATSLVVLFALGLALAASIRGPTLLGGVPIYLIPPFLIAFVGFPIWMLVTRRHEVALAILLVYLGVADGALKLQSSSEIPGLGRDLLLYAIAVGMLARAIVKRKPLTLPPLSGWVLAFVAVAVIQLANPNNGSPIHSAASLRQHLEFVPLFFIAYVVLRSTGRLRALFVLLAAVAAVNGVVGTIQLGLSPEQLSGWGPGYEALIEGDNGTAPRTAVGADGESIVRPPGLGSDMGFAGIVGAVAIPGALALLITGGRRRRRDQVIAGLLVLGAIAGVATSLARASVVASVIGVAAFVAMVGIAQPRKLPALAAGLAFVAVFSVATISAIADGREGDFQRLSSITPDRAVGTTIESREGTLSGLPQLARELPLGAGIGSVGPAAGVIDPPPRKLLNAESQFNFLIIELGLPGLVVFLSFNAALVALLLARIRRIRDSEQIVLLAALAAPIFSFMALWVVGVNTTSTPNAPYLWLAAGALSYWLGTTSSVTVRAGRATTVIDGRAVPLAH